MTAVSCQPISQRAEAMAGALLRSAEAPLERQIPNREVSYYGHSVYLDSCRIGCRNPDGGGSCNGLELAWGAGVLRSVVWNGQRTGLL